MASVISFVRMTGESRSSQMLDNGGWEVTETWQAKFDDEVTDPLDFLGDPMIPAIGTVHPENSVLYLKSCPNVIPPKGSVLRTLNFTLVWSTQTLAAPDKHDPAQYVDSDRATKSWSHRVVQVPVEKAYVSDDDGRTWYQELLDPTQPYDEEDNPPVKTKVPIENTVHDLIIPGITTNRYMPTCRYSRNELVVPASVLDLPGYVNDDVFTLDGISVPIGMAMIIAAPVSALKRSESYLFRTVDYEILINVDGWDEKILDRGFYAYQIDMSENRFPDHLSDEDGKRIKKICKVKNGLADTTDPYSHELPYRNVEEPVALNIFGFDRLQWEKWVTEKYIPGNPGEDWPFRAHYRTFSYVRTTSFNALGFN